MLEWYFERMREHRGRVAIVDDREYDYSELLAGLMYLPASRRTTVALIGNFDYRSCARLLELWAQGYVVAPLRQKAPELYRAAEIMYWLDGNDAGLTGYRPRHPLYGELFGPGLILFTSGSTGKPKAALHDLGRLFQKFRTPRPALRTLAFLLWDHIGGMNTLGHIFANGGTLVCCPKRDPESVCQTIEKHRVELLPAAPSFYNLLLSSGVYKDFDLSSLRLLTYGTEPMPERTLGLLAAAFPNVKIKQTYGLSETGILGSKSAGNNSTWVSLSGMETRIVDGMLQVRGPEVMLGYLNAESPIDQEGWYHTGDLVEEGVEGIRILGRASDLINVGGQKVYPGEVEAVIRELAEVSDVVVFGEQHPWLGQIVVARVDWTGDPADARGRIRDCCARLERYKQPVKVEFGVRVSERGKRLRR